MKPTFQTSSAFLVLVALIALRLFLGHTFAQKPQMAPADAEIFLSHFPHAQVELASRWFSASELIEGKYFRHARIFHSISFQMLRLIFLAFFLLTAAAVMLEGWGQRLAALLLPKSRSKLRVWVGMGFYVLLFFAALAVFELPGSFQGSFLLETAYGRSNETALQWLWRWIKARALLAVVLTPTALGFLALLRKYPRSWAWRTATFAWLLAVFLTAIQPLVIEPLFHDRKPLEEGLLRNDLTALAQRAGVPTEKIFVINASRETKRANAFFIGIGGTRQILLFDNLLVHYSFAEIESILAHEIGHWKMKHIVIGLGLLFPAFIGAALLIAWVFKRARTAEMEAARVPLFFFLVFLISYASEPLTNAISRKLEGAADRFALELTGDPAAFVTMEVKLAKDNLTDLLPHPLDTFYFASHPPPLERIRRAAGFGLGS